MRKALGLSLVEVLVTITLLAIQAPLVVGTLTMVAGLTRQAEAIVTSITPEAALAWCEAP